MVIINKWGTTLNYLVFSSGSSGGTPIEQGEIIDGRIASFGLREGLYNATFFNPRDAGLTGLVTGPILEGDSIIELKAVSASIIPKEK